VKLSEAGPVAEQRRARLAKATGLPLENMSGPHFDEALENGVRRLITATRDRDRYGLVFEENRNYGFARNILSLRPMGLWLSAITLAIGVLVAIAALRIDEIGFLPIVIGTSAAASVTAFWYWYPTERRVRAAAADYRDRLLEALDAGALEPSTSHKDLN
jgi:hypothetical protein